MLAGFIKPLWLRVLAVFAVLLVIVYAGDYVSIAFRIPNGRQQFGSVQVEKSFAVKLKDKKTEYMFQPPEAEQCAYSLFPQLGYPPCWYLRRHSEQQIDY